MKVRCTSNNLFSIKNEKILKKISPYICKTDGELDIETNVIYTVYGIEVWENHPWYYVCTDNDEYPTPYSSVFFEVIDERLSSHWILHTSTDKTGDFHTKFMIKEWAKDPLFYENLIDGEEGTTYIFEKSKKIMDSEYSTQPYNNSKL